MLKREMHLNNTTLIEQEMSSIAKKLNRPFRIRFMGSESTGKTQTSLKISKIFGGRWIPEYAREVWHDLRDTSPYHWVDIIARGQALYDLSALSAYNKRDAVIYNDMLTVHDTDINTTIIYMQQTTDHELEESIMQTVQSAKNMIKYDITFIMCSHAPWIDDGVRGNSLYSRHHYTTAWIKYLQNFESDNHFHLIDGDWQDRLKKCTKIVEDALTGAILHNKRAV